MQQISQIEVKDCMDEVINWELCKILKFDHTTEWYIHKPKSVRENETYWNFEIQTNHLISPKRPDLVLINKKEGTCYLKDLGVPSESWKIDKYLKLSKERN